MNEPEVFLLSPQERNSALWLKLRAHFKDKLALARGKNDGMQNDATVTAALRGDIRTLKAIIALDADAPEVS